MLRSRHLICAFLCVAFVHRSQVLHSQTTTINTSLCGCQPGAGSPCPGNTNWLVCTFAFNITSGCPSFTAINSFTTSGTYLASDIVNFKLYETNFSVFNTSTLVATIAAGLGPGAHTFSGFNRTTCAAAQRYYWITCDFAAGAVAGRTIRVDLITSAMYAVTGTKNYGTNTAAGTQTICSTLPVSLISFTGENKENSNLLQWKTSSESDNAFFTLERSADARNFIPVATIDGAGTTSQITSYAYTDDYTSKDAVLYYRLKQTDYSGQSEYVGGIVSIEPSSDYEVTAIVRDNSLIVSRHATALEYTISDASGRVVRSGTIGPLAGEISLTGLPCGAYILRLNDEKLTSIRFLKTAAE